MSNILVTGSNGQLGNELRNLADEFSMYSLFLTDKDTLDISNFKEVEAFVIKNKINVIVNCAAYTNVDKAEDEVEMANNINFEAVKNLAEISKKYQLKLIHISTDYVFEGTSQIPYLENDPTNPKNQYGKTKNLGEKAMEQINPANSVIIRTSWLYAVSGHNFVKTMLKLSKERTELTVVNDQIGSPTYAFDLAKTIFLILPKINNQSVEIYHYSNQGACSWFQFAQEIIAASKRDCKVLPVSSKEFNSKAYRPNFSLLNTEKIRNTFQIEIPNWKESLNKCLLKLGEIKEG
ncbi:dTDP-4-dehydrorhamnose reductase [Lutibacter sp.]|uniref:dTDP-4-dehydrorhamnose reductase n=1 Tax=Lutibacter sp. TaxID=1925666 RepID=UPI0035652CF7